VWEASAAASRSVFYTHRARLLRLGLVQNIGADKQPRYLTSDANFDAAKGSDPGSSPGVGPAVRVLKDPGPGPDQSYPTEQDQDHTGTGPDDQGELAGA
jgi:hypothetical protein